MFHRNEIDRNHPLFIRGNLAAGLKGRSQPVGMDKYATAGFFTIQDSMVAYYLGLGSILGYSLNGKQKASH
jgi:hypothetical protein